MIEVPAPRNIEPSFHKISVGDAGFLNVWEEAGTLWVLAHPELLEWPAPIHWLFSRVGSEGPGDLWGVDQLGHLLVVETKRSHRPGSPFSDPFEDFVKEGYSQHPSEFSTARVRATWRRQLEAERTFLSGGWVRPDGPAPGILPYSMKREVPFQWIELCRSALEPRLNGDACANATERALAARQEAGDPPPHFIGLFTVTHDGAAGLSKKGRASYAELVSMVGAQRVHLRGVRAVHVDDSLVRLEPAAVDRP